MISKETIENVRRIQLSASRRVTAAFAGAYRSAIRGRGLEFGEVREYQAGDDIRFIDWNVTARTGRPHVKKFVEERELTIMFLIDVSHSFRFGTASCLKNQLAAEICALLSLAAIQTNDRVGLVLFSDRVECFIPPGKGINHVLNIVGKCLDSKPAGDGTDISVALDYLNKVSSRSASVFIISDFVSSVFRASLAAAAGRHDVIAMTITDPVEKELPDMGITRFFDRETGKKYIVDTSDKWFRREYQARHVEMLEERKELFRSTGIDHIEITNGIPYIETLVRFFSMRERKYHRQ